MDGDERLFFSPGYPDPTREQPSMQAAVRNAFVNGGFLPEILSHSVNFWCPGLILSLLRHAVSRDKLGL